MLALLLGVEDFRFAACLLAVLDEVRFAAFFLVAGFSLAAFLAPPAFRLELFVDCFEELLAFRFTFAFPLAALFFRITFFFFALAAMVRPVLLIRFHLFAEPQNLKANLF